MLQYLIDFLAQDHIISNLFNYITFRAVGAAVTALLISYIFGPWAIDKSKKMGIVSKVREGTPANHKIKEGTPLLGGTIIIPAILLATVLFARVTHTPILLLLGVTVWMGTVGLIDDTMKIKGWKNGLPEKFKSVSQVLLGLVVGLLLYYSPTSFFGTARFQVGELNDPVEFALKIRDDSDPTCRFLKGQFSDNTRYMFDRIGSNGSPSLYDIRTTLINELNILISSRDLHNQLNGWLELGLLRSKTEQLLKTQPTEKELIKLNRLLLEDIFPEYIHKNLYLEHRTETTIPFVKDMHLNWAFWGIGFMFVLIVTVCIFSTSNALNLTDGMDGLAIGQVAIISIGVGLLAYVSGHFQFSSYLNIMYIPNAGEISIYCAAIIGASLGFLWYNAYPALTFMGDASSLALGGGLATATLLIKKELFLIILAGVLIVEIGSSFVQRYWFKYTRIRFGKGRRILKIAPLHHHYEVTLGDKFRKRISPKIEHELLRINPDILNSNPGLMSKILEMVGAQVQSRIVIRFWIIGILLLFITLGSFKVR